MSHITFCLEVREMEMVLDLDEENVNQRQGETNQRVLNS